MPLLLLIPDPLDLAPSDLLPVEVGQREDAGAQAPPHPPGVRCGGRAGSFSQRRPQP